MSKMDEKQKTNAVELLNYPMKEEILVGIADIMEESEDEAFLRACNKIAKFVGKMPERTRQEEQLHKEIMSLISEAKGQFSHIGEYGRPYMENADSVIDECSEKGIDILQVIDEKISVFFGGAEDEHYCSKIPEERTVVPQDDKTWHYISSGFLPDTYQDVLILSASGLVMEGYLMEKDSSRPFMNENGKIDFTPYEDGGAWFRYRFRDTLKMSQVIAWCYKPYIYDRNMEKRLRIGDLLARLEPATTVLVNDKPYDKLWDDKHLIKRIEVCGAALHITTEKGRI